MDKEKRGIMDKGTKQKELDNVKLIVTVILI